MLKLNGEMVNIGSFPDGTMLMKQSVPVDHKEGRKAYIDWCYENDRELVALIYLTKHLRYHGVAELHLSMPYIPNARQDRVKNDEDVFTLKYFSELINDLKFTSVTVLDPHSSVSEALMNNLVIKTPKKLAERVIDKLGKEELTMFYPDEGAMKRYSAMFDLPYAFGIKKRDWETGEIYGLDVSGMTEFIKDRKILILDDISSKGGTFYRSAEKLKELGAKEIYLYISHCENTILDGEVLTSGLIDKVFTTNSIFTENHERIEVMNYDESN